MKPSVSVGLCCLAAEVGLTLTQRSALLLPLLSPAYLLLGETLRCAARCAAVRSDTKP